MRCGGDNHIKNTPPVLRGDTERLRERNVSAFRIGEVGDLFLPERCKEKRREIVLYEKEKMFVVDPTSLSGLVALMDRAEEFESTLFGMNEYGEMTLIGVFEDKVAIRTLQKNGWSRLNVFYRDGTEEEVYEGRYE